jgi:hypothetical protein
MSGPVFIGGPSRSGKTLLRWILSSHPAFAVSRRTEMWSRFFGRFGELDRPDNLDRCLRAMLARPQVAALSPDPDALRRELAEGPATYARLFALVHETYARANGKRRWGDQSPGLERVADRLMASYPDARFLHVLRDPRDAFAADMDRSMRVTGAVGPATAAWASSASLAASNLERYPDAYAVVRYEALVTHPEATIRWVCAFLGEDFEPAMLRMEGVERYGAERLAAADGIPITAEHVGRFRRSLIPCEVAYIQATAGRWMRRFDYPADPIRLSAGERIHCAALWPVSLTRAGVRHAVHAVHAFHERPRASLRRAEVAR